MENKRKLFACGVWLFVWAFGSTKKSFLTTANYTTLGLEFYTKLVSATTQRGRQQFQQKPYKDRRGRQKTQQKPAKAHTKIAADAKNPNKSHTRIAADAKKPNKSQQKPYEDRRGRQRNKQKPTKPSICMVFPYTKQI